MCSSSSGSVLLSSNVSCPERGTRAPATCNHSDCRHAAPRRDSAAQDSRRRGSEAQDCRYTGLGRRSDVGAHMHSVVLGCLRKGSVRVVSQGQRTESAVPGFLGVGLTALSIPGPRFFVSTVPSLQSKRLCRRPPSAVLEKHAVSRRSVVGAHAIQVCLMSLHTRFRTSNDCSAAATCSRGSRHACAHTHRAGRGAVNHGTPTAPKIHHRLDDGQATSSSTRLPRPPQVESHHTVVPYCTISGIR